MILKFNEKLKSLHSTSKFVTNKILNIVYIFNSEQKKCNYNITASVTRLYGIY